MLRDEIQFIFIVLTHHSRTCNSEMRTWKLYFHFARLPFPFPSTAHLLILFKFELYNIKMHFVHRRMQIIISAVCPQL